MPEGDTIFRAARTLNAALAGRTVIRFESVFAHVARVHDLAEISDVAIIFRPSDVL